MADTISNPQNDPVAVAGNDSAAGVVVDFKTYIDGWIATLDTGAKVFFGQEQVAYRRLKGANIAVFGHRDGGPRADLSTLLWVTDIARFVEAAPVEPPLTLATTGVRMAHLRKLHAAGGLTAEELGILAGYYLEEA